METIKEAIAKTKELLKTAEEKKQRILQDIAETEEKKNKALQEAEESLREGNINKHSKAKTEAESYKERIEYLQNEAEKVSFADMKKDVEELQESVREISRKANRKVFDVYYHAWIEAEKAEEEATKIFHSGNWIITETDKLLKKEYSQNRVSNSMYSGMLKPSEKEINYIEAWNRMRERRRKEKSQK